MWKFEDRGIFICSPAAVIFMFARCRFKLVCKFDTCSSGQCRFTAFVSSAYLRLLFST